jgi:hypothetical protein
MDALEVSSSAVGLRLLAPDFKTCSSPASFFLPQGPE